MISLSRFFDDYFSLDFSLREEIDLAIIAMVLIIACICILTFIKKHNSK